MSAKYPFFGSRVREMIKAKGITIEKFSEIIGVSENFMAKIISGYAPSFHNFVKIAIALEVSADFLLQDYLTSVSGDIVNSNPKNAIMAKTFSDLTEPQKEEILRLANFLKNK